MNKKNVFLKNFSRIRSFLLNVKLYLFILIFLHCIYLDANGNFLLYFMFCFVFVKSIPNSNHLLFPNFLLLIKNKLTNFYSATGYKVKKNERFLLVWQCSCLRHTYKLTGFVRINFSACT